MHFLARVKLTDLRNGCYVWICSRCLWNKDKKYMVRHRRNHFVYRLYKNRGFLLILGKPVQPSVHSFFYAHYPAVLFGSVSPSQVKQLHLRRHFSLCSATSKHGRNSYSFLSTLHTKVCWPSVLLIRWSVILIKHRRARHLLKISGTEVSVTTDIQSYPEPIVDGHPARMPAATLLLQAEQLITIIKTAIWPSATENSREQQSFLIKCLTASWCFRDIIVSRCEEYAYNHLRHCNFFFFQWRMTIPTEDATNFKVAISVKNDVINVSYCSALLLILVWRQSKGSYVELCPPGLFYGLTNWSRLSSQLYNPCVCCIDFCMKVVLH